MPEGNDRTGLRPQPASGAPISDAAASSTAAVAAPAAPASAGVDRRASAGGRGGAPRSVRHPAQTPDEAPQGLSDQPSAHAAQGGRGKPASPPSLLRNLDPVG